MRIVSLLPSATEIVCALGLRDALVGRSHECDWPAGVGGLPAVSLARIDSAALDSARDRRRGRRARSRRARSCTASTRPCSTRSRPT